MPTDDNRRDDAGEALPDWLSEAGSDPIELDLPDDVDEPDDFHDEAMSIVQPGIAVPSVSPVWVATEQAPRSPDVSTPTPSRDPQRPALLVSIALLVALAVVVAIGLYVWQVW